MNRRTALFGLAGLALTLRSRGAHAAEAIEIAVVVHKSNGVAAMNRSQLSAIFKAKTTQFPGGDRASPVNLAPESPVRQEFDQVVLGLKPDEVERFWIDSKIRTGTGSPRKLPNAAAVLRFVAADATAIGYVLRSDANDTVRIVALVRDGKVLPPPVRA